MGDEGPSTATTASGWQWVPLEKSQCTQTHLIFIIYDIDLVSFVKCIGSPALKILNNEKNFKKLNCFHVN